MKGLEADRIGGQTGRYVGTGGADKDRTLDDDSEKLKTTPCRRINIGSTEVITYKYVYQPG